MKKLRNMLIMAAACALGLATSVTATQYTPPASPTTGTVTGLELTTNYNAATAAIQSMNSGAMAPPGPVAGQMWLDTSTTPQTVRQYSGTVWLIVGWLDTVNGFWIGNNGGGTGAVTTSGGGTADLGTVQSPVIQVNGGTTIVSFGSSAIAGAVKILNFAAAPVLTHNGTSLILPNGGSNITAAAGDVAEAIYLGGGNWRVANYQRANGASLSSSANFSSTVSFNGAITQLGIAASQNNWAPTGIATANVIRMTCTAAGVNITGLIAPSPSVDGQVIVIEVLPVSTNPCTFTSNDANSAAANRFLFARPMTVRPSRTLTVKYDLANTGWVSWAEVPEQLIAGGYRNLRLLNATNVFGDTAPVGALANNQYKGVFEALTLEDAFGGAKRISGPINVTDATGGPTLSGATPACTADVTGSGAGGLDTGAVAASTWYHFWFGYNPTTNVLTCFFSASSNAATITRPSGYTYAARVGAIPTDASTNKCFYRVQQNGRIAHYVATGANAGCSAGNSLGAVLLTSGNTGAINGATPTLVSTPVAGNALPVPPTAVRLSVFPTTTYKVGGAGALAIHVAPSQAYSGTQNGPTGTNGLQGAIALNTSLAVENSVIWMTLESANISVALAGAASAISIADWEDSF